MRNARAHEDEWVVPGQRMIRTFEGRNAKGEAVEVEFGIGRNDRSRRSLAKLWHRNGRTGTELETWWNVTVYVTDGDGRCFEAYNPTIRRGGYGLVLDFEWVMEATQENLELISSEIEKRAFGTARRRKRCE